MSINNITRKLIWVFYGGRCVYCHASVALDEMTIDHIVPKSKFEKEQEADDTNNLCLSCSICNKNKGPLSLKEFKTKTHTLNNTLLKLEAEKRKAEQRISSLTKEINKTDFAYIRYLRTVIGDDTLKGFGGTIPWDENK